MICSWHDDDDGKTLELSSTVLRSLKGLVMLRCLATAYYSSRCVVVRFAELITDVIMC